MIRRIVSRIAGSPAARGTLNASLERLVSRGTSAVVGLVVAVFVTPQDAGVYSMAFIALSLVQEVGENTMRQLGVGMWRMEGGEKFLRRAAFWIGLGGSAVMIAVIGAFWVTGVASDAQATALLPFVPLAAIFGFSVPWLTLAQFQGQWSAISRGQAIGGVLSLALCIPLAPLIGIAAGSIQTCMTEGVLLVLLARGRARHVPDRPRRPVLRDYVLPTVQSNFFGWAQGQSERVVIASFGGAATLGLYSIAGQVARAVSDAVVLGLTNVLRSRLAIAESSGERTTVLRSIVLQGVVIALAVQSTMIAIDLLVLGRVLDASWRPALIVVPIMSISAAPLACMWCLSSYLIVEGRARVLTPWHWVGVTLGIATGFAFAADLISGALVGLARDAVALGGRLPYVAADLGRRFVIRILALCTVGLLTGAAGYLAANALYH